MADSVIHTSFAAGEISPNLWARVDLDKYHVGARLMRNFFVDYRGGASSRPGTQLISRTRYFDKKSRLLPFIFSQSESYILEFGEFYVRFYFNGAPILDPSKVLVGITNTNPAFAGVVAHGYTTGDNVTFSGMLGMTELNGNVYSIVNTGPNNFSLLDLDGNTVDATGFGVYTGGGTVSRIMTISTPYFAVDLPKLKYVQSADVMTLTHSGYDISELKRTGPSTFTFNTFPIGPSLLPSATINATATTAGNLLFGYAVCGVTTGNEVGEPSTVVTVLSVALDPFAATPKTIQIFWDPVVGADHYHVFKWGPIGAGDPQPTVLGFIGQTTDVQFTDNNIGPDYSNSPPQARNPFSGGNRPGCAAYFDQRLCFGGLAFVPQEIDMSKVEAYHNFDISFTSNDTDAIQIGLASRQINDIKALVPMASGLVVLTTGGAFQVSGGSPSTAITPTDITALPQASSGANDLPPIVINYDILFVQNKGSIVRDLAFNFYLQTYYGFDRSALANHLFFNKQLIEWAYAEEPFKIVWATRNDGQLLSLTYVPEQEVYAWAHHDTQGIFESVCSVPEGQEDAVYFIVRRPYFGAGPLIDRVRYIERLASRKFTRVEDAWCLDCALNYPLSRPAVSLHMNANETTAFIQADTVSIFDNTWIGQTIWFDVGGKLRITSVPTVNQIICDILQPLGNAIPNTDPIIYNSIDIGAWEVGPDVSSISGLEHLQGLPVYGLIDGQVRGPYTVDDTGTIPLGVFASKIILGLKFQCQLQTLYLDVGDPTIQGKRKKISAVTLRLDTTRGFKVGENFQTLYIAKDLPAAAYTVPLPLFTGDLRVVINGPWNTGGIVCVQQDDPLPVTVLGLIPEVTLGDTQK